MSAAEPPLTHAAVSSPAPAMPDGIVRELRLARWWIIAFDRIFMLIAIAWLAIGIALVTNHPRRLENYEVLAIALLLGVAWLVAGRYRLALRDALEAEPVDRSAVAHALRAHSRFWGRQLAVAGLGTALLVGSGLLTAVNPIVNSIWSATAHSKTEERMRRVSDALGSYAREHASYPDVKTVNELERVLVPKYAPKLTMRDAWRHRFVYLVQCEEGLCYSCRLLSAGPDGIDESRDIAFRFPGDDWDRSNKPKEGDGGDDVVWGDGALVKQPRPPANKEASR